MLLADLELLIRSRGRYSVDAESVPWRGLATILVVCGFWYGSVMGSFGLRPLQALYSGLKVPILLTATTVICLPSFYVLNTLLGLRDEFLAACRGILAAQATLAIVLVALSPITALHYVSFENYRLAVMFNGLIFAIATVAAQVCLNRHYRPLIARNPRHRVARACWLTLYVFVAIQAAWLLRPYVGSPALPTHFLREEAFSNAYVAIVRDLAGIGLGR